MIFVGACLSMFASAQTRVKVETEYGDLFLKLYDDKAPVTVANFIAYVERGDYDKAVFHRSIEGFVLQTGGFKLSSSGGGRLLDNVSVRAPIKNESGISNLRGTLAMAKKDGDPDSATSQWFINLDDNSERLDILNGGFTVFGQVENMDVVDEIVKTRIINVGGAHAHLPIKDLSHPDSSGATDATNIKQQDLIVMNKVSVVTGPSSITLVLIVAGSVLLGSFLLIRHKKIQQDLSLMSPDRTE